MSKQTSLNTKSGIRLSHVARSSLLVGAFFTLDKLLGLLRQVVIGRQFGVSSELDAFNAANNLPDLLFATISGGALAVAFIPVLSQALERDGRPGLWAIFSRVANWAFLLTSLIAIFLAVFTSQIVCAEVGVAPGFTPELQLLVTDLMRLNLLATLVFSLSGLISAGLQANQHFLLPALAPVLFDLGQIFGALVLAPAQGYQFGSITLPAFNMGIHGLVYGVILGACLHLLVQVPGLIRYRFKWTPRLNLDHPGVKRVAALFAPRILTIGAFQLVFVLQDNLASRLDTGSITALAYGWLIMQIPETIFGTAIGTAILPTLSEHAARKDWVAFERSISSALRTLLALTIPAALLLATTLRPLVQVAFHFDNYGTELVVWAARAYLIGLIGHALLEVAARAFYAKYNARIPLLARALSTLIFILISLLTFRSMGAAGIGLSNSLAFTLEAGFLLFLLARTHTKIVLLDRSLIRIAIGSLLAAGLAALVMHFIPLPAILTGPLALLVGSASVLPFIWPEVRAMRSL